MWAGPGDSALSGAPAGPVWALVDLAHTYPQGDWPSIAARPGPAAV
jgi:hypothetical protein